MVTRAARRNQLYVYALEPVLQPLKTLLLIASSAVLFWWVADQCLGHDVMNFSKGIPEDVTASVRNWMRG